MTSSVSHFQLCVTRVVCLIPSHTQPTIMTRVKCLTPSYTSMARVNAAQQLLCDQSHDLQGTITILRTPDCISSFTECCVMEMLTPTTTTG